MLGRIVHPSLLTCAVCLILLTVVPVSAQIYVDADATGANDGSSWTDAFTDLQDALAIATSGNDIWVAAGTYTPTQTNDRLATFQLINGVGLYGGFAGTESLYDERDLLANTTILSGEIGTILNLDNSYHVVTGSSTDATAVIDGFTISDGYTPSVVQGFDGAGVIVYLGSPTLSNLIIANNEATSTGGGMYIEGGSPVLTNVVFLNNVAISGGGMVNAFNSDPVLTNVTFYGNTADAGGVMANTSGSDPVLTNVIAWGNPTGSGPRIVNSGGNAIISYCLIEGAFSGPNWRPEYGINAGNNISVNPLFLDAPGGDVRIALGSPARDIGDNAAPSLPATDLVGTPRISHGVVDMGAYEVPVCPIAHVDKNATGVGDGTSWADAYNELRDVSLPSYCLDPEIWVAAGTYTPTAGTDRSATFTVDRNLRLYGGFSGTETMESERDPLSNVTVLSGEIGAPGNTDNSYHVVTTVPPVNAIVDGFTISGGNADDFTENKGGGIYTTGGKLTLENVLFTNNAASFGGGLYTESNTTVNACTFQNNTGTQGGGANGTASFDGCEFIGNSSGGTGGGVYATGGSAQNCLFDGNTSAGNGGGLRAESLAAVEVNNCDFVSNTAGLSGGGAYGDLTLQQSTLTGNQAVGSGGGVFLTAGEVVETTFQDNTAAFGAGIYNNSAAPSRMISLVIAGNTATHDGGGVYNQGSGAKLLSSLVVDNTAAEEGGGLYAPVATTVINVTFDGNAANTSGGGIQNADASTEIANTILWTNDAPAGPEIAGIPPLISYSDVAGCGESGPGWNPAIGVDGGFNLDEDPLFVDEPGDDFHLQEGSHAVNSGDKNALDGDVATDLDGNPRVQCRIEMGPYELPWGVIPSNIRYVTADGNGDGTSWGCAFELEEAFALTDPFTNPPFDEVWVAAGTYVPDNYFDFAWQMAFYGGFAGWESSIGERDVLANPTILSGEVGAPGPMDNRPLVVRLGSGGLGGLRVLDGFVVTGGNSAGSGGGIKVEGPGIAHVRNCVITDNQAAGFGGGLYWESNSGDIWIVNCIFANNQAANGGGFAASSTPHFPDVTNSTFFNNSATVSGGGVWCNQGGPGRNLIFWGNTAPSNPQVSNLDVAYSIIQGSGGAGTGNIDADPMFINAPGGDFRIPLASPAVDAGTNSVTLPPTDIDGNPRVVYGTVDMGAFENVEIASGIDDEPIDLVPKVTQLRALYPNPFNPTVTIAFDLDRARHVSIEVYDVKGRRIATVLDETRPAGRYDVRWDAESRGRHLASGVYFVVIRSEGWRTERKIVLLK